MGKKNINRKHAIIIVSFLFTQFILAIFIAAIISNHSLSKKVQAEEKLRNAFNYQILDAASTKPTEITVDYSKQISTGSPLIFGGSHSPELEHQDAWNKIAEVGVTSVRKDFFPENALPKNITLEDYKNNVNGVQDPANWNQESLNEINGIYKNAKQRGMTTIGIVAYAPAWLTYSGTFYGVPRDWDVYEDIIKKTYTIYRSNLDFLEIWNEPDLPTDTQFLNTAGSAYTKKEAYNLIYYHTSKAIREVDHEKNDGKIIPLGGPVSAVRNDASFLETLLRNPQISKNLDFVSYHQYVEYPVIISNEFKQVLQKYNKSHIPIFITEWNYSSENDVAGQVIPYEKGILYAGEMLLSYLRMGVTGANYFSITPLMDNKQFGVAKNHAFYTWENGKVTLLPLTRAWRILSKDMKLGKGESKIYEPESEDKSINTLGLVNVDKEPGIVIVNNTDKPYVANIKFDKIPLKNYADVEVFYASKDNDAKLPEYKSVLKIKNGKTDFVYYVPAQTIMAVKISGRKDWFDFIINK